MSNVNIVKRFAVAVKTFDSASTTNDFLQNIPENDIKDIKTSMGSYGVRYTVIYRKPVYDVE